MLCYDTCVTCSILGSTLLLLDTLLALVLDTKVIFNTTKTVCVVFNRTMSRKAVSLSFPELTVEIC